MQQLTEIPRALGVPEDAIQTALVSTFVDPSASNPFSDLGLADADFANMLATLVNNSGDRNGLDSSDGPEIQPASGARSKRNHASETHEQGGQADEESASKRARFVELG